MTMQLSTRVLVTKRVLRWREQYGWSPRKINLIPSVLSEQVCEKCLVESVKNIQFKSCRTLKNTQLRRKKKSWQHEKSSWHERFWFQSSKNSKTSHNKQQRPGQIIFTKADMRKMQFWLDTEQYQKNGRYKKKSHFTPSALTFKEL